MELPRIATTLFIIVCTTLVTRLRGSHESPCPVVVLASSLYKVRDQEPWCGGETARDGLKVAAAQNEYESFQVVVNRPNATVIAIHVRFDGESAGAALLNAPEATLVHRAEYIDIQKVSDCDGEPGRWPDALIPERDPWDNQTRNAFPAKVSGRNALFWVDIFVRPDVAAGNYTARVTVKFTDGSGGDSMVEAVPLRLRVFGFALDSTSRHYKSSYGLSPTGVMMAAFGEKWRQHVAQTVNMTQRYIDLGLMHRLSFTHGGIVDPALSVTPIDWMSFERRWGAYIDVGEDMPFGLKSAAFTSVQVPATYPLNAEFYAHAEKRGWVQKLVTEVCDEPSSPSQWAGCASTCAAVHSTTPSARCEVTTTLEQLRTANQSLGAIRPKDVGIFTALINFVENSAEHCSDYPPWSFRNTREDYDAWLAGDSRRELWMYQSCMSEGCYNGIDKSLGCDKVPSHLHWPCQSGWPSLMIDAPAIMNRVFPSLGYFYNASGELYWHTNYADTCTRDNVIGNCPVSQLPEGQYGMDPWTDQLIMGGNGDGQLTYPGRTDKIGGGTFVPIASIRLKHLRDGMEDNEYLHLLEEAAGRGRAVPMQQLRRVITNAFSYTRDVELWNLVRETIGSLIEEYHGVAAIPSNDIVFL